jgi:predicted amino acid dehydrogenase
MSRPDQGMLCPESKAATQRALQVHETAQKVGIEIIAH